MPGLERHRRNQRSADFTPRCRGPATRRCGAYPVRRWLPASRPRTHRTSPHTLHLHGVHADIVMFHSVSNSVGAGLLAAARDFGCDMLAMGAYSHSRLRQLILGGVTRHVLEHGSLPIMMNR